ncbi:hypothetical protein HGRIS_000852 [Hohenbuehelia grisea]|uniref:Uncharacterized protein n=1 Tax=Hohenbuehelia grisea TaxID=104357 RepID=A0ABR3IPY8_9AGAR
MFSAPSSSTLPMELSQNPRRTSFGDGQHDKAKKTFNTTPSRSTPPSSDSDTKGSRRSSLISMSSRLLNNAIPSFSLSSRSRGSSDMSGRSSRPQTSSPLRRRSTNEDEDVPEVWITKGGPITIAPRSTPSRTILQDIDPFASSPESRSFFIDLAETPSVSRHGQSFISFTTPTSPRNSLSLSVSPTRPVSASILPISPSSNSHKQHGRTRPLSLQTFPLPSNSRRSSLSIPSLNWDKQEIAWRIDEASPILPPSSAVGVPNRYSRVSVVHGSTLGLMVEENTAEMDGGQTDADDLRDLDSVNHVDWRQFHIDHLLKDE